MIDSFKPAIQALQAKNAPLEESIRPVMEQINANKRLINQLCAAAGVPAMHPEVEHAETSVKRLGPTRTDEYTGRPLATVIREILEQRKAVNLGAIHIDELYDTMKEGGYIFDNKDAAKAKNNMAVSLGKNSIFARVGESANWGLAEWYPGLKRDKNKNAGSPSTASTPPTENNSETDLASDTEQKA
jgi:hypothetical protein